jgi:hypothetical protein
MTTANACPRGLRILDWLVLTAMAAGVMLVLRDKGGNNAAWNIPTMLRQPFMQADLTFPAAAAAVTGVGLILPLLFLAGHFTRRRWAIGLKTAGLAGWIAYLMLLMPGLEERFRSANPASIVAADLSQNVTSLLHGQGWNVNPLYFGFS